MRLIIRQDREHPERNEERKNRRKGKEKGAEKWADEWKALKVSRILYRIRDKKGMEREWKKWKRERHGRSPCLIFLKCSVTITTYLGISDYSFSAGRFLQGEAYKASFLSRLLF